LPLFGPLALGDVNGDPAHPHDTATCISRRGRRANAPALFAIGAYDPKFRFMGASTSLELADRSAQFDEVDRMQQRLDVLRGHVEIGRFDAENPVLALVPHPVAVD